MSEQVLNPDHYTKGKVETMRKCPTCGEEFEPHSRNHKYCSKECKPKN